MIREAISTLDLKIGLESAVVSNRNIIAIVRLAPNIYADGFFV